MRYRKEDLKWKAVPFAAGSDRDIIALMQEDIELRKSQAIFDEKFWNWKYKDNSAGFYPNWIWLAMAKMKLDEGIVGHYSVIPVYLEMGRAKALCGQSVDILTRNDFREQGVFSDLAKKCYEEVKGSGVYLLYCYPNDKSYHGFVKKLGWLHIFTVDELVYVLNAKRVSNIALTNPILRKLAQVFLFFRFRYYERVNRNKLKKNYEAVEDNGFRNEHSELAAELRRKYKYFVDRSIEYLTWRYLSYPIDKKVVIKSYFEKNLLRGFYVLKIKRYPHRGNLVIGHVMEFIAAPDDHDLGWHMLREILDTCRSRKVDIVHAYTHKKQHDYKMLKRLGFMKYDQKNYIIRINERKPSCNDILKQENWFISLGDSDRA